MSVAPPHELVLQGYLHKQAGVCICGCVWCSREDADAVCVGVEQSKHLKIWRIRYFMLTKASDRLDLTTIDGKPQCRIAADRATGKAGRRDETDAAAADC